MTNLIRGYTLRTDSTLNSAAELLISKGYCAITLTGGQGQIVIKVPRYSHAWLAGLRETFGDLTNIGIRMEDGRAHLHGDDLYLLGVQQFTPLSPEEETEMHRPLSRNEVIDYLLGSPIAVALASSRGLELVGGSNNLVVIIGDSPQENGVILPGLNSVESAVREVHQPWTKAMLSALKRTEVPIRWLVPNLQEPVTCEEDLVSLRHDIRVATIPFINGNFHPKHGSYKIRWGANRIELTTSLKCDYMLYFNLGPLTRDNVLDIVEWCCTGKEPECLKPKSL